MLASTESLYPFHHTKDPQLPNNQTRLIHFKNRQQPRLSWGLSANIHVHVKNTFYGKQKDWLKQILCSSMSTGNLYRFPVLKFPVSLIFPGVFALGNTGKSETHREF